MLNRIVAVQVSDTTKLNSVSIAGYQINFGTKNLPVVHINKNP